MRRLPFFILCLFYFKFSISLVNAQSISASLAIGGQISGIKNEDFISSNLSPKLEVALTSMINKSHGIIFSYQGLYFNTIANTDKRYYTYISGALLSNLTNSSKNNILGIITGAGIFYNHYYNRPNICADLGIFYSIGRNGYSIQSKVASIIGWDIYQGNLDILPSISIGYIYPIKGKYKKK